MSEITDSTSRKEWSHHFPAEGGHVQWSILELGQEGWGRPTHCGYHITSSMIGAEPLEWGEGREGGEKPW